MRNKASMLSVKQLPIIFVLLAEISPIFDHKTEHGRSYLNQSIPNKLFIISFALNRSSLNKVTYLQVYLFLFVAMVFMRYSILNHKPNYTIICKKLFNKIEFSRDRMNYPLQKPSLIYEKKLM